MNWPESKIDAILKMVVCLAMIVCLLGCSGRPSSSLAPKRTAVLQPRDSSSRRTIEPREYPCTGTERICDTPCGLVDDEFPPHRLPRTLEAETDNT
jgi:hypothetical protein